MSEEQPVEPQARELSIWLIVAIVFVPLIFAWFTLRRGYSPLVRAAAIGWAIIATYAFYLNEEERKADRAKRAEEHKREDKEKAIKAKQEKDRQASCLQESVCVAKDVDDSVFIACAKEIEKLARYDTKWETWSFKRQFPTVKWADIIRQRTACLSFAACALKFQNGFGAWSRRAYACEYDTSSDQVRHAVVFDGPPDRWDANPRD